jgi:ATP-dependent Clp protease adaptor protein ClpS
MAGCDLDPSDPFDPLDPVREGDLATERRPRVRRPRRYKVLLHNDDYTTMEFVVRVLVEHFHKSPPEATHVMLQVHYKGLGVAGVYPKEVAETKVAEVTAEARAQGMPLVLTIEAEGGRREAEE